MGWRFRRSFSILPGIRFNLGKTGTSWSFGRRGFHYTIGKTGTRTTIGIPGTGLSHTTFNKYNTSQPAAQTHRQSAAQPPPVPSLPGTTTIPIGQPKRNGKAFFIIGGSIFGVAVLANILNSGSKSSTHPTIQPPISMAITPTPRPLQTPIAPLAARVAVAPISSATLSATPLPTIAPSPRRVRKVTLKTVKTIYPDSGGTRKIDPGTELKVIATAGGLMTVELDGQTFNVSKSQIIEHP